MKQAVDNDVLKRLTTTPPAFTRADAEQIANQYFGIDSQADLLASERDQNFCLRADDGQRFALKIANHAEQLQVVDFQNKALLHIANTDASIPVPRVIPGLDGRLFYSTELNGRAHIVRLLSWMEGQVLYDVQAGPGLIRQLGNILARLGIALENFDHAGSNPPLLWDMKRAAGLRSLLAAIEDQALKQLIVKTLDRFDEIAPILESLRSQVIYNDLNPDNVLLDTARPQQISGIIDFGDLVKSPLIIDLAVAAAYYLAEGDDPLAGVLPMIAGYHELRPLQSMEMEILTDLIRTRLVTSLLIMSWRMSKFPENREYLQRSQASSKAFLASLDGLDPQIAFNQLRTACKVG